MTSTRRRQRRQVPAVGSPGNQVTRAPTGEHPPKTLIDQQAAVVFSVALAVRAVHFWLMRSAAVYQVLICDAAQYDLWAQRIARGNWIGNEVFYQTPLYPYFLAVNYAAFGHHVWVVRIVQAMLGAAACALLARAGSRLFSQRVGWVAGLMLALYAPAIFFDGILQKAALDLFLMSLLVWLVAWCPTWRGAARWIALGAVVGALVLNRENAAVLVPVLGAWVVWLAWQSTVGARRMAIDAAVLTLGIALVLLPVGLRNYYVGGELLLTTSQMGPNFFIGNHREANGRYESLRPFRGDPRYEQDDARVLAEEALGRALTPNEVSNYWMDRTWDDIRDDPLRWLRLLAFKGLLTLHRSEVVDGESLEHHQQHSPLLGGLGWTWHFGLVVPLAAAGLYFSRHDWRRLWVLYAMIAAFAAAVAIFYVFARYRYPLVPLLMLFAAVGVVDGWRLVRDGAAAGRVRELACAAALAAVAAVASNWPLPALAGEDSTWFNIGTAWLDLGKPAEAIAPLEQAAREKPGFPVAYHNLGLAALALGELEQARSYFEQALEIDPQLAVAHFNLARTWHQAGDREAALGSLKTALEIDPLLPQAHQLGARIAFEMGDVPRGMQYLERAVELNPRSGGIRADLGMALLRQGRQQEAVAELRMAVDREPTLVEVANNLAWILATSPVDTVRNPSEALQRATEVCELTSHKVPGFLDTLAAAQAASGQFAEAAATVARAIELAGTETPAEELAEFNERRQLYLARRGYRDHHLAPPTTGRPPSAADASPAAQPPAD